MTSQLIEAHFLSSAALQLIFREICRVAVKFKTPISPLTCQVSDKGGYRKPITKGRVSLENLA